MSLVQGSLGGISGGVSQQPDILRFPGQCTEQTNMLIDTVNGLRKRGPVSVISILDAAFTSGDAYFHWFSLEDIDYLAVFTSTGVKVFGLDGTEYVVDVPDYSYMSTFYSTSLSSVQVGEYNLIANSEVIPAMSATIEDNGDEYVTFHISDGMAWGVRYIVRWDGNIIADYTAPPGDVINASTTEQITSIYIAASLYTDINTYATPHGWTVVLKDNTIIMKRLAAATVPTALATKWTMEDSVGGSSGSCVVDEVQTLDELPPVSWAGHWLRVSGTERSSLDDFYMRYVTDDGTSATTGVWKETHNPTEKAEFDETTMPHALIRTEDGDFLFTPLNGAVHGGSIVDTWNTRKSGDAESNPVPAFIGKAIFDMTIVQQRLVIVTDDHLNLSKTQKEFTYWSTSAVTDTDTDPIELVTPGERAAHLFAAAENEQNLIVLGKKKQFAVPLRNALNRSNTALVPTTSYDVLTSCRPTVAGGGLFFAFSNQVTAGVREYRTGDVETIQEADEVTSHLGSYLPTDLKQLEADRQNNVVVALPYTGNELYYYQFLDREGQRAMSAWGKISINNVQPLSLTSIDGHFFIVAQGANGLGLYRLEQAGTLFLDYQTSGTITSGTVDLSSWAFSSVCTAEDIIAVVSSGPYSGLRVQIDSFVGGVLSLTEGSLFEGETVTVGVPWSSTYIPTMPVLRDRDGKAIQVDRLTVNFLDVTVKDTGSFSAEITAPYYEPTEQYFSSRIVGSTFVVGENPSSSRKVQVSVGHDARNVDVGFVSEDHTDLIIQSLEYKGSYTRRGMRL